MLREKFLVAGSNLYSKRVNGYPQRLNIYPQGLNKRSQALNRECQEEKPILHYSCTGVRRS